MTQNPVFVWDFTIKESIITKDDLIDILYSKCKKFVFQVEKGEENEYLHYQGRLSLKEKTRRPTLLGLPKEGHYSPTTNENKDNNFYVMKETTRVNGPWSNEDEKPLYIPRQIRDITTLYAWQQTVIDSTQQWDTRTINVILDTQGNNGKSTLKAWVGAKSLGRSLPYFNDYKDFMRIVMDTPKKQLYILDIPRAIRKDKLFGFFAGIESLKDGYAYDDRYHFREQYFDCPQVWVFMNIVPDLSMLSKDRWKLWVINENMQLKTYEVQDKKIN
ncbi:MAG: replication associated protein [Wigfec virus K19_658]|nr:MAG: replication associated protein [Wigfec virus K19_658]